jgi:hypothetical protein
MRPLLAALALVAGALALAACGKTTIDAKKGETFIRGVVTEQIAARVRAVRCPDGVKTKKGDTFMCAVTGADGSRGNVIVTQRDDDGNVTVDAPFLHVREAEAVMAEQIAKEVKADDVQIECPEIVVVKKDALFTCRATSAGKPREVSARLTDEAGHFRYRLS